MKKYIIGLLAVGLFFGMISQFQYMTTGKENPDLVKLCIFLGQVLHVAIFYVAIPTWVFKKIKKLFTASVVSQPAPDLSVDNSG